MFTRGRSNNYGYSGYRSWNRYGYRSGYKNRNWGATGSTGASLDPRKYGEYTYHDRMILSRCVGIIAFAGNGARIICFHHAGLFYFGTPATKLLENQVQYMMPSVARLRNGYPVEGGMDARKTFSLGIVPHLTIPQNLVVVGAKKARRIIFNFLASNVLPVLLNKNDIARQADMFGTADKCEMFGEIFANAFGAVSSAPLDEEGSSRIINECIDALIAHRFIQLKKWRPDHKKTFRSWYAEISEDLQLQPGGDEDDGDPYMQIVSESQTDLPDDDDNDGGGN